MPGLGRYGLAERSTGSVDRRIVTARATASGKRMVSRVAQLRAIDMQRLLEPFDGPEGEQFAGYLERFVTSIDALVAEVASEDTP